MQLSPGRYVPSTVLAMVTEHGNSSSSRPQQSRRVTLLGPTDLLKETESDLAPVLQNSFWMSMQNQRPKRFDRRFRGDWIHSRDIKHSVLVQFAIEI